PVLPLFEFLARDGGPANSKVAVLLLEGPVEELPQPGVMEVELVEIAFEAVLAGIALHVAEQPCQVAILDQLLQAAELLRVAQPLGEELLLVRFVDGIWNLYVRRVMPVGSVLGEGGGRDEGEQKSGQERRKQPLVHGLDSVARGFGRPGLRSTDRRPRRRGW